MARSPYPSRPNIGAATPRIQHIGAPLAGTISRPAPEPVTRQASPSSQPQSLLTRRMASLEQATNKLAGAVRAAGHGGMSVSQKRPNFSLKKSRQGRHVIGRGHAGYDAHFKAHMALSDNLPAPPASFDPDKQYHVKLTRTVPVFAGDTSHMLRPSDYVVVKGSFATTIRQFISGAQAL